MGVARSSWRAELSWVPGYPPRDDRASRPSILEALGLVALFFALVAVAPGALLTFAIEHLFRVQLDVGRRWTRAIASRAVAACVMSLRSRRGSDGLGRNMVLAVVVPAVVLVARFALHARWASELLREYVPLPG
ncbi:MAG: hypothetical protein ABI548_09125 [Polyangiaceae bacterium]